jgi:hypothetical protein
MSEENVEIRSLIQALGHQMHSDALGNALVAASIWCPSLLGPAGRSSVASASNQSGGRPPALPERRL